MIDEIFEETSQNMGKTVDALKREFKKVRTGRASISILDGIRADYYGTPTPLNQLATLAVPESRLITIQPWDTSVVKEVEKAILKSDLGLTPSSDGKIIRIAIPPLTEERRKELVKVVSKMAEDHKIAIRNIRRDANDMLLSSESKPSPVTDLDPTRLPAHVAVIMDGNGRWAKRRLLNRIQGHEKGAETVRRIVRTSREIGIDHLTLYAFSTENWQRSRIEVEALMALLKRFLETEKAELLENDIRLNAIGRLERLPADVQRALSRVMEATRRNSAMTLHLALSYGARTEICDMVRAIAREVRADRIQPPEIDERVVAEHLYTREIPDPDLLIRTSGEMRISNFLLWQIAYAEIFVTPTLWPDFSREEFLSILRDFQARDRRFGKVAE